MIKTLFFLFLSSLSIAVVYYPGLTGGFVFDDISNILQPSGIRVDSLSLENLKNAAFSMDKRPLARASFGLNYLTTGFDPFYFKAVNIAIHSINSFLVYLFTFLLLSTQKIRFEQQRSSEKNHLTKIHFIAAAVAFSWALHPINLTNVLYVVQRMNSFSALFVLAAMALYVKGRIILDALPTKGWFYILTSVLVFLPLGLASKENAALLPLFLFIIELTIFRFYAVRKKHRIGLYIFYSLLLILPALLAFIYIFQHYDAFFGGFSNRYFSLTERLLTETRVIWLYIKMILLPAPSLFGLFQDDITVSTSLYEPFTTVLSITGLLLILVVALSSIKRLPILSFGLLFFLAGHLMESTFIPLELVFEHRNYLPSIGLLLPFFYYVGYALFPNKYIKLRFAGIIALILIFALQTHLRAWTWSDNSRLYLTEAQYHPNSPRANYQAGKVYGQMLEQRQGDNETNYNKAIGYFEKVTTLRENTTSGLFGSILASIDAGKKIQPEWIEQLEQRLSTQPLEQVNLLWLDKLTDCIIQAECNAEDLHIPTLIQSTLNNTYLNNINRAMLYTTLAKYAARIEKNKNKSVAMARNAVSQHRSNLYYQINLAGYLLLAGEKNEAKEILKAASKMDRNKRFTGEISRLMENL